MNPKSTHCGLRPSEGLVWKNIIRSKRLINQLLDAIASHTLMEIHGGVLVLLGHILKDFIVIWSVSLITSIMLLHL